jgi:hypothetical protein
MNATIENLSKYIRRERMGSGARRITCESGLSLSVQAGSGLYSEPREDAKDLYTQVEVGFPSSGIAELMPYCEDPECPTDTVYAYVPTEIVVDIINRHGGTTQLADIGGDSPPRSEELLGDEEEMKEFDYSHNNSGGANWMTQEQWEALEGAGWTVDWTKEGDYFFGRHPANGATKRFLDRDAAVEEWERLTGNSLATRGCDCCGPPHSLY